MMAAHYLLDDNMVDVTIKEKCYWKEEIIREHQFMSANALVAGAFFVLLFENLEHKVLFLGERNIPSRSVELHM